MKRIYKFKSGYISPINLPTSAKVVHFGTDAQNTECVWIELDTTISFRIKWLPRHYKIFGTGDLIPEGSTWQATYIDGAFVWHLYEVLE